MLPRDFRPDSFGSEDLQQDGARDASVNEVDLVDTRLQGSDGGTDLAGGGSRPRRTLPGRFPALRGKLN